MISFADQSFTILRPAVGAEDAHGEPVKDWGSAQRIVIESCSIQPGASDEVLSGRDTVSILWTVFAPDWVEILPGDAAEFEGVRYAIDGEPARWPSPTGSLDNTIVYLKRWEERG